MTSGNLMPESRKGKLDVDVLTTHGLTKECMKDGDPLFFLQMLLPTCDPAKSGIEGDNRTPFYTVVRPHKNIYIVGQRGWDGGYHHDFKTKTKEELVEANDRRRRT